MPDDRGLPKFRLTFVERPSCPLLPTERRPASLDLLCGWLNGFDRLHVAVGGVVLECFTDSPVPCFAERFGLVVA